MTKSLVLVIAGFLLAPVAFGQDRTATPSICRQDLALWGADMAGHRSAAEVTRSIPMSELSFRLYEMNQCGIVDASDPSREALYQNMYGVYLSSLVYRWNAFIKRHGMTEIFLGTDDKNRSGFVGAPSPGVPTIEQCRADVTFWTTDDNNATVNKSVQQLHADELMLRDSEMDTCSKLDADEPYAKKYRVKVVQYMDEIGWRFKKFFEKFGLLNTVIEEDATVRGARE
jgi:hypothetical protein